MRIAHLSDLHAEGTNASHRAVRNVVESIADSSVDHLIITGDLTNGGRDEEYEEVIDVLKAFKYIDAARLTVVPGNHDLFNCVFRYFSQDDWPPELLQGGKLLSKMYRVITELRDFQDSDYRDAIETFNDVFRKSLRGTISVVNGNPGGYPRLKFLSRNLVLVLLDSNYWIPTVYFSPSLENVSRILRTMNPGGNVLCCNGWLEGNDVLTVFDSPKLKSKTIIVLLHHYLYSQATVAKHWSYFHAQNFGLGSEDEYCRDELCSLLSRYRVDLALHGHLHTTDSYHVHHGRVKVLNGGGWRSVRKWNMIDTENGRVRTRVNSW